VLYGDHDLTVLDLVEFFKLHKVGAFFVLSLNIQLFKNSTIRKFIAQANSLREAIFSKQD
jgi:hypothetical protein